MITDTGYFVEPDGRGRPLGSNYDWIDRDCFREMERLIRCRQVPNVTQAAKRVYKQAYNGELVEPESVVKRLRRGFGRYIVTD